MIQYVPLLEKYSISPNQLYLIWCLASKNKPIKISLSTETRILINASIIDDKGKLTPLGLEIASELIGLSKVKTVDVNEVNLEKYV